MKTIITIQPVETKAKKKCIAKKLAYELREVSSGLIYAAAEGDARSTAEALSHVLPFTVIYRSSLDIEITDNIETCRSRAAELYDTIINSPEERFIIVADYLILQIFHSLFMNPNPDANLSSSLPGRISRLHETIDGKREIETCDTSYEKKDLYYWRVTVGNILGILFWLLAVLSVICICIFLFKIPSKPMVVIGGIGLLVGIIGILIFRKETKKCIKELFWDILWYS